MDGESIIQTWFYRDGSGDPNPNHGAAIVVFYFDLDTKNPKFNYAVQPTEGSKIEIYE